jgi:hypothetical protein
MYKLNTLGLKKDIRITRKFMAEDKPEGDMTVWNKTGNKIHQRCLVRYMADILLTPNLGKVF